jgi:hypothetical protein
MPNLPPFSEWADPLQWNIPQPLRMVLQRGHFVEASRPASSQMRTNNGMTPFWGVLGAVGGDVVCVKKL